MNFDVRFIHGRQTIELKNIHLTVGAAVRVPIERHQRFYEIVLWRTNPSLLTVALLPRFSKAAWRWSGRVRMNSQWTKLALGDTSSPGRWSCEVRHGPKP